MNEKRMLRTIFVFVGLCLFLVTGNLSVGAQNLHQPPPKPSKVTTVFPELISQVGGRTQAVALQGNYAYIGSGRNLLILDVSNPSQPLFLGQTGILPGSIYTVAVADQYAYVDYGSGGFGIIDISNPMNPSKKGFYEFPGVATDVVVAGNYVYVADRNNGLRILNISNPVVPKEIGFLAITGNISDIEVTGNLAYVAAGSNGLRIIDISIPTTPTEVGFIASPGFAISVKVSAVYAYLAADDMGLRIIDVSNPATPTEVGFYLDDNGAETVTVAGNYAYVIQKYWASPYFMSGRLIIIDITNPNRPSKVGQLVIDCYYCDVITMANFLYIANGNSGLLVLDISIPSIPAIAGSFDNIYDPKDITVSGKFAYVAEGDQGLRIINVSDPTLPKVAGVYDTPDYARRITVADRYAYVADRGSGLRIIDVFDPANPVEVGFSDTSCDTVSVTVSGKYAYTTDYRSYGDLCSELRIIDVSNPSAPIEVGVFTTTYAYDVAVKGKYAYVADGGLRIIDISDPSNPIEVGFYGTPGRAAGVVAAGNYAYLLISPELYSTNTNSFYSRHNDISVPIYHSELIIIDISNPTTPEKVGLFRFPTASYPDKIALEVRVVGDYVYVADGVTGLHIMDVSMPEAPVEVGSFDNYLDLVGVALAGNYAFIAESEDVVISRLLTDMVSVPISPDGGSLTSTDGNTSLIFPTGAFTGMVNLTYRQMLYDENLTDLVGIGHTFELSAVYTDTEEPADLAPGQTFNMSLLYSDAEVAPAIENTLAFYTWDGTTWEKETSSTINPLNNLITATPNHLSLWTVLGETNRMFLPILGK